MPEKADEKQGGCRTWAGILAPAVLYLLAVSVLNRLLPAGMGTCLLCVVLPIRYRTKLQWKQLHSGRKTAPWLVWSGCLAVACTVLPGEAAITGKAWPELLAICIAGPVAEELIYRGMVLERSREAFGRGAAIFISALLFSAAHPGSAMAAAMVGGAAFAAAVLETGCLWPAVLMHLCFNGLSCLLAFYSVPIWAAGLALAAVLLLPVGRKMIEKRG